MSGFRPVSAIGVLLTAPGLVAATDTEPPTSLTVTIECHEMGELVYDPQAPVEEEWSAEFVIDRHTLDFGEAWSTPFPDDAYCDVVAVDGAAAYELEEPATAVEVANWEATAPEYRQYTLGVAYSHCTEHGTLRTREQWPVSVNQVSEALEMFEFCPDHPDQPAIEERITALGVELAEIDAGVRFGSGLYRVGDDIQPGTYFSENETGFENCYWERQDAAGRIIENNYAGRVFRVEVTIAATDYAFLTQGCGQWAPLPSS